MQIFIDTTTQKQWAFDDDVVATQSNGVYSFVDARGAPIATPLTLQPYVPTGAEIAAQQAAAAQAALMLQANAALDAGIAIKSTSTPALNGTYAVDRLSQMDIIAIETSLNAGKGFPGGSSTFSYPDVGGVPHTFTEANFTNFAAAIRDYVYGLKSVMNGASTNLPTATMQIS